MTVEITREEALSIDAQTLKQLSSDDLALNGHQSCPNTSGSNAVSDHGGIQKSVNGKEAIRPAKVCLIKDEKMLVDDGQTTQWATLALAYPYDAQIGDTLLVAFSEHTSYVIGVLNKQDTLKIATRGDIEFQSRGQIRFVSRDGLCLESSNIHIKAQYLSTVADRANQHFESMRTTVSNVISITAKELRNRVKGRYKLKAEIIDQRAKENVNIDGKKINLG